MAWTLLCVLCVSTLARTQVIPGKSRTSDGDYNSVNSDGSFDFGYANHDRGASYHLARGTAAGVVGGRFGARDPATNTIKETVYTAGPRGFRAKGPNVHRKMDLDQRPRGPIGDKDDPYYDPNEDPSYAFKFDTRTYSKNENADSRGDVKGHYSFVDDVGERHDVSYIAGSETGFHVTNAVPDNPNLIGAPFHRAPLVRGEKRPRGKTAVQRGLDGSYRFISVGPDQRRSESSDSHGNVRGSYTFLDDKGVQRTVNYIAGPGIGYRIVKNGKDPFIPAYFPTIPSVYDPDFVKAGSLKPVIAHDDTAADDVFKRPGATAASGHVKPSPFDKDRPRATSDESGDIPYDSSGSSESGPYPPSGTRPGYGAKPGSAANGPKYGANKPGSGSNRPNYGANKPGSGTKGPSYGSNKPGSNGPSYGSNKPGSGTNGPGFSSEESSFEDNGFGTKPSKGKPGQRPIKPYPTKKPYVPLKPFQTSNFDDEKESRSPEYAIGFNIQSSSDETSRPTGSNTGPSGSHSGPSGPNSPPSDSHSGPSGPNSRTGSRPNDADFKPPKATTIYNPGSTIIRNVGEDYFGVPPGVSVRAHVQSIDLYPYDSKPMSPSEAIEKDKTSFSV